MPRRQSKSKPQAASFDKLVALAARETTVGFEFKGEEISFRIRSLTDEEIEAADAHVQIQPPLVPGGTPGDLNSYDYDNEDFKRRSKKGNRLRVTALIEVGAIDIEIPGGDLETKMKELHSKLPPAIIDFLVREIEEISNVRLDSLANFTSTSGSESSPS